MISRFLLIGPTVKYRPKLSFSSKKVTNIKNFTAVGFWLINVGNGYFKGSQLDAFSP